MTPNVPSLPTKSLGRSKRPWSKPVGQSEQVVAATVLADRRGFLAIDHGGPLPLHEVENRFERRSMGSKCPIQRPGDRLIPSAQRKEPGP